MARRKRRKYGGRDISGIVLLDKPAGMTSNAALQQVKQLFNAGKAGHTGSLDPLATGMLPVCFGEGTKVSPFLLDADKTYRLVARLGVRTSTGDSEGEVIERRQAQVPSAARLEQVLQRFRGEIEQVPPMYSALKHNGERLYKLARQGVEVERKPRKVMIHRLALLSAEADTLTLEVKCSKGTYIRTLAEDIGEALGCGAHVSQLRRLQVGVFTDPQQMYSLPALQQLAEQGYPALDQCLFAVEQALSDWPEVVLPQDSAYYLAQGQAVLAAHAPTSGLVRLVAENSGFFGMGQILEDGRVAPKRLFNAGKC